MKKFIFCFICLLYSGCAITTTTLVGDITTYTQNGEVLQKWERVVLQEFTNNPYAYTTANSFKTFGVNFYDEKSGKHIIIGNAVPYIIEYTVENNDYEPNVDYVTSNTSDSSNQIRLEQEKNKLINQWKSLSIQEQQLKSLIKTEDKGSEEYQNLKNRHKGITTQMDYVNTKLKERFGYDILTIGF